MLRKTALLAGVAGALLITAPAFAQDATAPQTPTAPAEQAAPAAPQSLTLQPGATVRGSDGAELGKLEGARRNDAGQQELTVRGTDGQLRAVPLNGLTQQGADVVVGWTVAEYQAAAAIEAEGDASEATTPAETVPPAASEAAAPSETNPLPPTETPTPEPTDPVATPDASQPPVEAPTEATTEAPETPAEPQR